MTPADCIAAASRCLQSAYARLYGFDGSTVEEAADAALTPTGPGREQLVDRIRRMRDAASTRAAS